MFSKVKKMTFVLNLITKIKKIMKLLRNFKYKNTNALILTLILKNYKNNLDNSMKN
jgi:hypothetical protein